MNLSIIHAFIDDQRRAKNIVLDKFGISPEIKAFDWTAMYSRIRREYQSNPFAEVFRPHGFGLELAMGDLYIDYDYSEEGRPDGFDAWRLYVYVMAGQFDNSETDDYFCRRIFDWVEQLCQQGRIRKHDNLYYFSTK